jgi:hypothetical protein
MVDNKLGVRKITHGNKKQGEAHKNPGPKKKQVKKKRGQGK